MTNAQLLERQAALQAASEHVQSVRGRYALQKTLREVESALQTYRELLRELADENDVDMRELQEGNTAELPDAFREGVEELLQMDEDEPDVHRIPLSVLDTEDEKGSEIPLDVIARVDFMIAD